MVSPTTDDGERIEPTDRVAVLDYGGAPAGIIGEVVGIDGGTPLVHRDGRDYPSGGAEPVPADSLRVIGCEVCAGTGVVAERREGHLYRTACPECAPWLKRAGYLTGAEEYHLRHVE